MAHLKADVYFSTENQTLSLTPVTGHVYANVGMEVTEELIARLGLEGITCDMEGNLSVAGTPAKSKKAKAEAE